MSERGARGREKKLVVLGKETNIEEAQASEIWTSTVAMGEGRKGEGSRPCRYVCLFVCLSVGSHSLLAMTAVARMEMSKGRSRSPRHARSSGQLEREREKKKLATGKRLAAREEDGCCAKCHGLVGRAVPP